MTYKVCVYDAEKNDISTIYVYGDDAVNYTTIKRRYMDKYFSGKITGSAEERSRSVEDYGTVDMLVRGGDDDSQLDDIDRLLHEKDQRSSSQSSQPANILSSATVEELILTFNNEVENVPNFHIFPEDNFMELREKIFLTSGIPPYRQHLFYFSNGHYTTVYNLYTDGLYNTDIRTFNSNKWERIHGAPIDKNLFSFRDEIIIESYDRFRLLRDAVDENTVFVCDLAFYTRRIQVQLNEIANNQFQLELFYYGFIVKFWPILTFECFLDYIKNETDIQFKYPDLMRARYTIKQTYRNEAEIMFETNKVWDNIKNKLPFSMTTAILSLIGYVDGNTTINIRNLFDKLRVSHHIPEMYAYIEHSGYKYEIHKKHMLLKNKINFPKSPLFKRGLIMAISIRKPDEKVVQSDSDGEQSQYMFLNILDTGRYVIKVLWNEEDSITFDNLLPVLKKFVNPQIELINELGYYVFSKQDKLPLISKATMKYQSLNIAMFWKQITTDAIFRRIRAAWAPYMAADIVKPRKVQQFNLYEVYFHKGVFDFDAERVDSIIRSALLENFNNYYSAFSNKSIKQKWDKQFNGRVFKMSTRTTDVKFEILNIKDTEFDIIYKFITTFVHNFIKNEKIKQHSADDNGNVKKLKKLRERDPELYNLKKHGSTKTYSVLCQNKHQPHIYTEEEFKNMPKQRASALTKYWNFTLNRPAYYGCPNPRYPYFGFTINLHPKNYCLPCCRANIITEKSLKSNVYKGCFTSHMYPQDGKSNMSRHIMTYGKEIDIGRLSKIPESTLGSLFYGAQNLYVYGVEQNTPNAENIGSLYCASLYLEKPVNVLVTELAAAVKARKEIFNSLSTEYVAEFFATPADLAHAIQSLMTKHVVVVYDNWNELIFELVYHVYGLWILLFNDLVNDVEISIPIYIRNDLEYIMYMLHKELSHKENVFVSTLIKSPAYQEFSATKIALAIRNSRKIYPIVRVNADDFIKFSKIEKTVYEFKDNEFKTMINLSYSRHLRARHAHNQPINLIFMKEWCSETDNKIIKKWGNNHSMIYGVTIQSGDKIVYLPIEYSVNISDGIEVSYAASNVVNTQSAVDTIIHDINEYIDKKYKDGLAYIYTPYQITQYVLNRTTLVGYLINNMLVTFSPVPYEPQSEIPVVYLPYSIEKINNAILSQEPAKKQQSVADYYSVLLYKLFTMEFIILINQERNAKMRAKIAEILQIVYKQRSFDVVRDVLHKLLEEYPEDYVVIQAMIVDYLNGNRERVDDVIERSSFEFDKLTINRLRAIDDHEALKAELIKICEKFVVKEDIQISDAEFPNVYMTCYMKKDEPYCSGNKLRIGNKFEQYCDILATDIKNDVKLSQMTHNIFMENILDIFRFDQQPHTLIDIHRYV